MDDEILLTPFDLASDKDRLSEFTERFNAAIKASKTYDKPYLSDHCLGGFVKDKYYRRLLFTSGWYVYKIDGDGDIRVKPIVEMTFFDKLWWKVFYS